MTDLITAEEAEKLLDGTTPGPWLREAQGIYADNGHKLIASVKSHDHGIAWPTTEANGNIMAAAPNLVRTVIALHAQLADAEAAQAAMVEAAAEIVDDIADQNRDNSIQATNSDLRYAARTIRALAPASGVETLAKLRAERDAARNVLTLVDQMFSEPKKYNTTTIRDQVRAALATQEAGT